MDYTKAKLYKIYYKNPENNKIDVYISSTTNKYLSSYFSEIKYRYINNKKTPKALIKLYDYFNRYGTENFYIELINDNLNAKSKDEINKIINDYNNNLIFI